MFADNLIATTLKGQLKGNLNNLLYILQNSWLGL